MIGQVRRLRIILYGLSGLSLIMGAVIAYLWPPGGFAWWQTILAVSTSILNGLLFIILAQRVK